MTITISQAIPSDAASISLINSETWFDTYQSEEYGITQELVRNFPHNDDDRNAFIERKSKEISDNPGSYCIARDGEKVVWYAQWRIHQQKPFNELAAIYILKEYQGKWIWKQLAEKVFDYIGKERDIIVEVIGYNKNARTFYTKLWFVFLEDLEEFEMAPGIWVPEIRMLRKASLEKALPTLIYWKKSEYPDCILLMGLPGTGKSYVSRYLHEKYKYTVLSGENITYALFGDTKCLAEQYKEAYDTLYIFAKKLLDDGYKIVIDGTNLQYAHRKQAYDAIWPKTNVFWIHLVTTDVIARKRIGQRGEKTDNATDILSQCSPETFCSFKESFEPPREDEDIYTIVSDENAFISIDTLLISKI